jgi:hypothetical protein
VITSALAATAAGLRREIQRGLGALDLGQAGAGGGWGGGTNSEQQSS